MNKSILILCVLINRLFVAFSLLFAFVFAHDLSKA